MRSRIASPMQRTMRLRPAAIAALLIAIGLTRDSGGRVEFGKRSWARKFYDVMFAEERGHW
jgi:hypothetical protein